MADLFTGTVPVFIRYLGNMSTILDKARDWAKEKGISEEELLQSRIVGDMEPFRFQIAIMTSTIYGLYSKLAEAKDTPENPPQTETTIAELQKRIADATDFLKAKSPSSLDGLADKNVVIVAGARGSFQTQGRTYALDYAVPNFFFHFCMAYAILRGKGLDIGKFDYVATIFKPVAAA